MRMIFTDLRGILIKILRKFFIERQETLYTDYIDLFDQEANDYILKTLQTGKPCMISKFGTIELHTVVAFYCCEHKISLEDYINAIKGKISLYPKETMNNLCSNAGFFPNDLNAGYHFYERVMKDIQDIDILGSYIFEEKYLENYLHCTRVNLEGYYAPFLWKNPWTKYLKGKKVLVVHPFVQSIKEQYEKRSLLFENPDVLPEFKELILVKAVQSMVNENVPYKDWFEALSYMERQISELDFDIALIGCGAYGMSLAAYVKRLGKQAVHLAGWTQMLFGIYGNRWLNEQDQYRKYINSNWVRPNKNERPNGAEKVENACYW